MDLRRHRITTVVIGIIFLFAVMTNVLIIYPDILDTALAAIAILLVVGTGVRAIVKYKRRLPE